MASYRGFKEGWPRYTMFALDIKEKPHKTILQGVEPKTKAAMLQIVPTGKQSPDGKAWGWENTKGSTGITSLGNGLLRQGRCPFPDHPSKREGLRLAY